MNETDYKKIFSRNLNTLLFLNNKTQSDLIQDLGFNKSAVSTWCNGTRLPRMDKVEMLAAYFHVDKSDLIEDKMQNMLSSSIAEIDLIAEACHVRFKNVLSMTLDENYTTNDTLLLRNHFYKILTEYANLMDNFFGAKYYWDSNGENIIKFYRERDPSLTETHIKEIFLRHELNENIQNISNISLEMPRYLAENKPDGIDALIPKLDNKEKHSDVFWR